MPELKEVFEMVSQKVEPDVDAWRQQDERQRRRWRNRKIGAMGLVAALAVVGAILVVTTRPAPDSDGRTVGSLNGAAPSTDALVGVWLFDGGPDPAEPGMLMSFQDDGTFAIDAFGTLDTSPATRGTYELAGRHISFLVEPSARCPTGETFTFRAAVPADGRLHTVMSEPGCDVAAGVEWTWTRVSPASAGGTSIERDPTVATQPIEDVVSLQGIWLLEGTGQLLRISWSGAYVIDDAGRLSSGSFDVGELAPDGGTLSLSSGRGSRGCHEGDRWVWDEVRVDAFAHVMRATQVRDDCGHGTARARMVWIRISGS